MANRTYSLDELTPKRGHGFGLTGSNWLNYRKFNEIMLFTNGILDLNANQMYFTVFYVFFELYSE